MSYRAVVPTVSVLRAGQQVAEPDNLRRFSLRTPRLHRPRMPCRGTLRLLVSSIRWPDEVGGDAIGGLVIGVAGWNACLGGRVDGRGCSATLWRGFRNSG